MGALEGRALQAAAERLCVLRGYATAGIGEQNEAGEDPLVRLAADGALGAASAALLLAAGAATGGEALVTAALNGHYEGVAALIDAKVDVDSRARKVR